LREAFFWRIGSFETAVLARVMVVVL
jgi:hypothetical protein